ncbi:MAG: GIY-YIG nuclease family protein [Gammaproteobacteria bacterium]|nr:GIY-YIG nuclease family protein [Gammaproteobacteria bacterium]MDH5629035.1 GIY-YIG nuclease family protein [Gammaproteobacteria bacterium]
MNNWFVYIIESEDGRLYTGITNDIARRMSEHCHDKKGAKFFRISKPSKLLYVVSCENRSEASKLEYQIKRMSKQDKLALIESCENQIKEFNTIEL